MALNVTTAVFGENCNTATASPSLAQWDTEQVLQISGIELPDSYKVEFSTVYTRNAIPEIGDASGVTIPNVLLQRSASITAYIVLYGENGGRNREYWITIYITPGQPPETITPDPEQADVIDQAIAALNSGVARTEAAATAAEGSARDAEAAAVAVQNLSVAAETLATGEPATVEKAVDEETGAVTLTFGLPRGVKGDPLTYEDLTQEQKAELVQGPILEAQNAAVTAVGNARASAVDAVGSAGTTQVNAVNQAGTTQVQAVEDKGNEVLASIPQDYTDLVDDVTDLSRQISDETTGLDTKAPVIINTASGAIASFDDGADSMPVKKLVAQIEPVQDLHGYDSPWPAGGGVNLLFVNSRVSQTTAEVTYTSDDDFIYLNGTKNGQGYATLSMLTIALEPGTYYVKAFALGGTASKAVSVYGNDGTSDITGNFFGQERTFVVSTAMTLRFRVLISADGTVLTNYKIGIVVSKTSGIDKFYPYENLCPISGHTGAEIYNTGKNLLKCTIHRIEFPETIYGGEDEVISGKLKSTMAMVDLGTLNWTLMPNDKHLFYAPIYGIKPNEIQNVATNIKSDRYKTVGASEAYGATKDCVIGQGITGIIGNIFIMVVNRAYSDAASFKTAMSGAQLVYELAEPVEYTLTANELTTLYGTNNIWASTGDTEVTYPADTKLYIDGKITQAIANALNS